MIETPQIVQTEVQTTAIIHLVIPREEIGDAMGPAINELMSTLGEQGISPTGPLFSHHLRRPAETFDFEISVPVEATVAAVGRVHASQLPATTAVRTVYHGPYEGLGEAWGEFSEWIEAQGYKTAEDLWEVYVAGPESDPDPKHWRTELYRLLLS